MNNTFKVNYYARDFATIKEDLKNYAKRYYSDQFSDLSEASINSFMIDSVAYVGDILSYYLDFQANESFLATAVDRSNVVSLATSMGYKGNSSYTTTGKIALYMLIPSDNNFNPDFSKAPIIKRGSSVASRTGIKFLISEDIIIDSNLIGTNFVVARTNAIGNPTYYAIKIYVPIISGETATKEIEITDFIKFNKVFLGDSNAAEIISVFDSEGNEYYEVPNLSQNIVYKSVLNKDSPNSQIKYTTKPISALRRFVFVNNEVTTYMLFGNKQYNPDDDLTIDPVAEPKNFILNKYNSDFLEDATFEPNRLLNNDYFGIGPSNTTLTVTYRRNSTINNTVNSNEIVGTDDIITEFLDPNIDTDTSSTILSSFQVVNEEPIVGFNGVLDTEELRQLAGNLSQAQSRAVTARDYETLTYTMPQKYGSIKRCKAERDGNSLKNNINLYIISSDVNGNLVQANTQIKQNLKNWLAMYKIITDTVDIIDTKIINLGIEFTILADPALNKLDVRNTAKAQLELAFSKKPQIGETFNILQVYRELQNVNGILDVKDIKIVNKTGNAYSSTQFNIQQNLTSDGNMIIIPKNAIYEIKNASDIVGNIV
jgi:hypothetical protein